MIDKQTAKIKECRLPCLDTARGLAVVGVVIYHMLGPATGVQDPTVDGRWVNFKDLPLWLVSFGKHGVAVFFVLSGFCIHLSYARQKTPSWVEFFTRRGFRIIPTYWFWLIVFSIISLALSSGMGGQSISYKNIGIHFIFLQNLRESLIFSINPSFWSLSVELQLYIAFPMLIILFTRTTPYGVLLVTLVVEVLSRAFFSVFPEFMGLATRCMPTSFWFSWSLGAFLAHQFLRDRIPQVSTLTLSIITLLSVVASLFTPLSGWMFTIIAIASFSWLAWRLEKPSGCNRICDLSGFTKVVRCMGVISYSLYLIHQPVLMLAGKVMNNLEIYSLSYRFLICVLLFVPILIISWMSHRFLELPSIGLGKRVSIILRTTASLRSRKAPLRSGITGGSSEKHEVH